MVLNKEMKGKVLRVYSRRLRIWKSLHRSCWTELTCQGNLLP